jgi:hypothetical protein
VSRLFGAYIIVDYSAAEGKKTGDSSVWIGVMKRDVRFRLSYERFNPATRAEAATLLRTLLADLHKRGDRVFLGFDFALGFVRGTSAQLALSGETPRAALWDFLAKNIVDKPDNTNNRFAVAAKMNRLMTDAAYPFWGCPKSAAQKWLSTLKPDSFGDFPEYRFTEEAARAKKVAAKSLWQMHGAGVVGGQSMLGIVMLKALLSDLGTGAKAWPFDTGFGALDHESLSGVDVVIAEIYPSLYETTLEDGEYKDEAQVRCTAEVFADLDDRGALEALFAAPTALDAAQLDISANEEGWILGV